MARIEKVETEKVLKIGQCIEITLLRDENQSTYSSRIEDIEDNKLILALPMDQGYPIIPTRGSVFEAKFVTEVSAFRFSAVFMENRMGTVPVWVSSMPRFVEKFQQREFVRVEMQIPLKVQLQNKDDNSLLSPIKTYIRDISGGGMRILLDKGLKKGEKVYIEIELPEVGLLTNFCEVVRSFQPIPEEKIFWVGIRFIDLPNVTRSKLIRFIFKKQREMIQKSCVSGRG